eukprot:GHVO01043880.1.p1 GENE.GHVO01043880.1~~GHVO01043880.1.p1  ORF type:complete len:190 (+),score=15.90 GHVO01043880.1:382-951(+)
MTFNELVEHLSFVRQQDMTQPSWAHSETFRTSTEPDGLVTAATRTVEASGRKPPLPSYTCNGCGEVGHFRRDCPNIGKEHPCKTCGSPYHTEAKCRRVQLGPASARILETGRSTTMTVKLPTMMEKLMAQQEDILKRLERMEEQRARRRNPRGEVDADMEYLESELASGLTRVGPSGSFVEDRPAQPHA